MSLTPFAATPVELIRKILKIADLKKDEVLYDLGSGDGRVLIVAAKEFGARAVGVEIQNNLVDLTKQRIREENLEKKVQVIEGDLFDINISQADVVYLYLPTSVNERIRPKLEKELKEGARAVSHDFTVPDWIPEGVIYIYKAPLRYIYIYKVSLRYIYITHCTNLMSFHQMLQKLLAS